MKFFCENSSASEVIKLPESKLPVNRHRILISILDDIAKQMVKILSNGDIVPDNDPRASGGGSSSSSSQQPRQRQGFVRHDEAGQQQYGQQVSIFEMANQKLRGLGIPSWNLGQYTVQPIVTVGCLVALMVFGLPGIIFAAVLFFVVNWSQQNAGPQNTPGGQGQPRGNNWGGGGGGNRLG